MKWTTLLVLGMLVFFSLLAGCEAATPSDRINSFQRVGSLDLNGATGTVSSISDLAATSDGLTLVYSSGTLQGIGLVDISDPTKPTSLSTVLLGSTPSSLTVTPDNLNTLVIDEDGSLYVVQMSTGNVVRKVSIAVGARDISATTRNAKLVAIVVNNAGQVQKVTFQDPVDMINTEVMIEDIELNGLALPDPDHPDPTSLDIHDNKVAVTLQRNNGLAIIDIDQNTVLDTFSLGTATERFTDLTSDGIIAFNEGYPSAAVNLNGGARMARAVAWSADGRKLFTADQGTTPRTGGRGWSVRDVDGSATWDDGGTLEAQAVGYDRFPEGDASNLGIELSRVDIATFGEQEFAFFISTAGSFLAIYELPGGPTQDARFVQLIAMGNDLREVVAVPSGNLVVIAGEGTGLTFFQGNPSEIKDSRQKPLLRGSVGPWGALSGLAGDLTDSDVLFAVPDNAFSNQVYRIELTSDGEVMTGKITRGAVVRGQSKKLDPEGLTPDTSIDAPSCAGFWVASEGNARFVSPKYRPNLLVQLDCHGQVLQEVSLPPIVDSPTGGLISQQGFEGVAVSSDGRFLLAAIKSQYADEDEANSGSLYTRIARYNLENGQWDFFLYPLPVNRFDNREPGGLADIVNAGDDCFLALEREVLSDEFKLRRVRLYKFKLDDTQAVAEDFVVTPKTDLSGKTISKTLLTGVVGDYHPTDNVEAITLTADGGLWSIIDDDAQELRRPVIRHGNLRSMAGGSSCP